MFLFYITLLTSDSYFSFHFFPFSGLFLSCVLSLSLFCISQSHSSGSLFLHISYPCLMYVSPLALAVHLLFSSIPRASLHRHCCLLSLSLPSIMTSTLLSCRLAQPLDRALCGHAAAVSGGEIFISGGCDSRWGCLPYLWRYDPSHGCSSRAPMVAGVGRAGHAMLTLRGKLLVVGGLQPLWAGFGDQLECEAYDPTLDTWVAIPRLPGPHLFPAAVLLDGVMYVLGGSSVDTARDTPWVHRYDPRTGRWDNLGKLPRPYADLAAGVLQLPGGAKK